MRFGLTALCMAFALAASAAARVAVPSLPVSPYADTEVATNISLRSARTDAVRFDLRFQLDGTPTNNLSLCFGRDVNTNGVLEVGEVETVYGWRAGRYFVEDVVSGEVLDVVASKPLWSCFLNFNGGQYYGTSSFPVLDCEAYVLPLDLKHERLWETSNKSNRIFNDTPKDDFSGETVCETNELGYIWSAHRNELYVISDRANNTFNVTERLQPLQIYRHEIRINTTYQNPFAE